MPPFVAVFALILIGCDSDRIAKLEKQNQELAAKLSEQTKSSNLALQAECLKQAETEFQSEGYIKADLASFQNHYNINSNKCFMELFFSTPNKQNGLLTSKSVMDVFEKKDYAEVAGVVGMETVMQCSVTMLAGASVKCKTFDEFDELVKQFMEK